MTDNEIIKALECCREEHRTVSCKTCPLKSFGSCTVLLAKDALALINRQQAEIAVLKHEVPDRKYGCCVSVRNGLIYTHTIDDYDWLIGDISAVAIKEFAERLRFNVTGIPWCEYDPVHREIDRLVKEMVGDTE